MNLMKNSIIKVKTDNNYILDNLKVISYNFFYNSDFLC